VPSQDSRHCCVVDFSLDLVQVIAMKELGVLARLSCCEIESPRAAA
jgi:hypothetical protein